MKQPPLRPRDTTCRAGAAAHSKRSTTRRSVARSAARTGFTMIEMVIVTAIIVIMAGLIAPNLVSFERSRQQRNLSAALLRLPTEARNEAAKSKDTVSLRVDGDNLVMARTNADSGEDEEVKRVNFAQSMSVTGAQLGGDSTDSGSWKWQTYPDGTSDSGGLTFRIGQTQQNLWIPADGNPRWMTDAMPNPKDNTWTAGNLLQRTGTAAAGAAR